MYTRQSSATASIGRLEAQLASMTKRANDLGAEGRRCGRSLGSRQSCLSLLVSSLYILDRIPEYVVRRNQYPVTHLTKFCCLTRSVCAKRLPLSMFETICFNASGTFLIPISSACEDLSPRLPALFISLASANFELQKYHRVPPHRSHSE